MRIQGWTRYVDRGTYVGVISGAEYRGHAGCHGKPRADSAAFSESARQAAMAAEMERDGVSREVARKLASGRITLKEPDWEAYEVQTLLREADHGIYHQTFIEVFTGEQTAISDQIQAYYAPALAKLEGMSETDALRELWLTYMGHWLEDRFRPGTEFPEPPGGMSRAESEMAFWQLRSLFLHGEPATLRDEYALGAEGIARMDGMDQTAREQAQRAYDAAEAELEAEQEAWKAQQKEALRRNIQTIHSGQGTCLGYMALRPKEEHGCGHWNGRA